jgi:hypothetical protein
VPPYWLSGGASGYAGVAVPNGQHRIHCLLIA